MPDKIKDYYKKANKSYDKANAKRQKLIAKRKEGKISEEKAEKKISKAFAKHEKSMGASAKFPEIKKENQGKFTAWVEKNMGGMDTCKAASKIMRSRTKKYSPSVVKMANYANNFGCKTKKNDGASVPLKGKQKNLPEALQKKILASDGASLRSKRADKLVSQGRLHKKMSPEQKKEAIKNKSARFEGPGASMKKKK